MTTMTKMTKLERLVAKLRTPQHAQDTQRRAEQAKDREAFRRQVILALCHGTSVNTNNHTMDDVARRVIQVANAIVEIGGM